MTDDRKEEAKRLLMILKRASDIYQKTSSFAEGTKLLKACEPVIKKLHDGFGINETWLESLIIFGGEFYKAEKANMYSKYPEKKEVINEQIKL